LEQIQKKRIIKKNYDAESKEHNNAKIFVLIFLIFLPLIFGAVHPIVSGIVTFLAIIVSGIWVVLNYRLEEFRKNIIFFLPPFLLVLSGILSSFKIPVGFLSLISETRYEYILNFMRLTEKKVAFATISYTPHLSLTSAIFILSLILFFILVSKLLKHRVFYIRLLYIVTFMALFEAIYGIFQAIMPSLGVLWISMVSDKSSSGSIIYSNQYAAFLNICLPMVIALAIVEYRNYLKELALNINNNPTQKALRHQHMSFLIFFSVVIIALGVIFSNSRAGILIMFLILIFSSFSLPLKKNQKFMILISIFALMFFYSMRIGISHIINEFFFLPESGFARYSLWEASIPIIRDHFWTGTGLSSYFAVSSVYLKNFPENIIFDRAHNEYLEIVIETGVPVMLMLLTWIIFILFKSAGSCWNRSNYYLSFSEIRSNLIVKRLAFISISAFLFHAFFDFVFRLPANLFYIIAISAFLANSSKKEKSQ